MDLNQIAQELKETIQGYYKGMNTLEVEAEEGVLKFIIKPRNSAKKIMRDLCLTGIFKSISPMYLESIDRFVIIGIVK